MAAEGGKTWPLQQRSVIPVAIVAASYLTLQSAGFICLACPPGMMGQVCLVPQSANLALAATDQFTWK